MKVRWAAKARYDRVAIWDHIAVDNGDAAIRLDKAFSDAARRLADFPFIGHTGLIAGTREISPHRNYRLAYEVRDDIVWTLTIVHAARQWPPE